MAKIEYKINRIKDAGYKIRVLGKNIKAEKGAIKYTGSVSSVFRNIFGY